MVSPFYMIIHCTHCISIILKWMSLDFFEFWLWTQSSYHTFVVLLIYVYISLLRFLKSHHNYIHTYTHAHTRLRMIASLVSVKSKTSIITLLLFLLLQSNIHQDVFKGTEISLGSWFIMAGRAQQNKDWNMQLLLTSQWTRRQF